MVKHIVLWNLKPELTKEERIEAGKTIKEKLEGVKDQIPGAISLQVHINELEGSSRDVALISVFESVEALNGYQVHPAHLQAAGYVRSVTCDRACFDFCE